ncbi:unnamed protein product [Arctogadus glacialis]
MSWCVIFLMVFNTPCDRHNQSIAIRTITRSTESSRTDVHMDRLQGGKWEVRATWPARCPLGRQPPLMLLPLPAPPEHGRCFHYQHHPSTDAASITSTTRARMLPQFNELEAWSSALYIFLWFQFFKQTKPVKRGK